MAQPYEAAKGPPQNGEAEFAFGEAKAHEWRWQGVVAKVDKGIFKPRGLNAWDPRVVARQPLAWCARAERLA